MYRLFPYISILLLVISPCIAADKTKALSPFVDPDTFNKFLELPTAHKLKQCDFESYEINWREIDKGLPQYIKGFNSRMDNRSEVENIYAYDVYREFGTATTFAIITQDEEIKERLLSTLALWADEGGLTKTTRCYQYNKKPSLLKICEDWKDKDGQDLAPNKDATVSLEIILGLMQGYQSLLVDFNPDDDRHKVIKKWFKSFFPKMKKPTTFYFGNFISWHTSEINRRHLLNKNYSKVVKKALSGVNAQLLEDGSFKDRTTRGNKALWYHYQSLGEAFQIWEAAIALGLTMPDSFEQRMLKAIDLFYRSYIDSSYIVPWAKVRHKSQFDPDNPNYQTMGRLRSLDIFVDWMYIYRYRFPDTEIASWLRRELGRFARGLQHDGNKGYSQGCIYASLATYGSDN